MGPLPHGPSPLPEVGVRRVEVNGGVTRLGGPEADGPDVAWEGRAGVEGYGDEATKGRWEGGDDGAIGSGLDQAGSQAEGSDERLGGGEGVGRGSRAEEGEEAGPQAGASDQGNDGGPGADME